MGDTTWLTGTVTDVRVDPVLGPLIELRVVGTNQRGQENITADATILVASRVHGPVKLPTPPPVTLHRADPA
jgi:acyl dehydratase